MSVSEGPPSSSSDVNGQGDATVGPEAWIPINAGYRVQKQSLKKFRRVIIILR